MSNREARYDAIADWYVDFTRAWNDAPVAPLPADLAGQRVVDLGCGYGVASRYLVARGASVTAIDLSPGMIAQAQDAEAAVRTGVDCLIGDVTGLDWRDEDVPSSVELRVTVPIDQAASSSL